MPRMKTQSLTIVAINALKAMDKAERAYTKAQKTNSKTADLERHKEKMKTAALMADRGFAKWRSTTSTLLGPDSFGPK